MTGFQLHHVGVAVADIAAALPFYKQAFGLALVSGPFADPIQKVTVCFVGSHPCLIELIQPLGGDSPINRTLAQGLGAYHLCYEVADLGNTLLSLRAQKCVPVGDPVPAVAFGGRRIAWMMTPTKQLVELLEQNSALK